MRHSDACDPIITVTMSTNVFRDLGFSKEESAHLLVRADLLDRALTTLVRPVLLPLQRLPFRDFTAEEFLGRTFDDVPRRQAAARACFRAVRLLSSTGSLAAERALFADRLIEDMTGLEVRTTRTSPSAETTTWLCWHGPPSMRDGDAGADGAPDEGTTNPLPDVVASF